MSIKLHYETTENESSAPWLVLIHGLFGSLDNLAGIKRHFSEHYNILSIDLPDHGLSQHFETFDLTQTAHEIDAVLQHVGAQQYHLLGHSLGGKAAMLCALHYPDKIASLMVADIAPVDYPARHDAIIKGLEAVDLATLDNRKDADKQLSEHVDEPGVRQFLLKSLYQNDQDQWTWRFNLSGLTAAYDEIRSWPAVNLQYSHPTLFIKGSQSDYIQADHQDAIAALFPAARAHVIQGVGHWLHAEKPAAFNAIVENFLKQQTTN